MSPSVRETAWRIFNVWLINFNEEIFVGYFFVNILDA